jgi:hypothetical protein
MYMTRLEYDSNINVKTLKLDTMGIYALLRELKTELAVMLGDMTVAKGFYPAGQVDTYDTALSTTLPK